MKIYKVGGAVRDALLGYPSSETDWVVVGGTPDELLAEGYVQVGKDFPVFLHPKTKEEYALARTERKSGHGYHGFTVHADPSVTLEEDLARRDLTINAIAMDAEGQLVDPYQGQSDLEAKLLRHVSPHFVEDPLRVLRVARFAARYAHLGFSVAAETLTLMRKIVAAGELSHLSIERVWVETERALGEPDPAVYFQTLKTCEALAQLLPAIAATTGIEALQRAAPHTHKPACRWAALLSMLPERLADKSSSSMKAPKAFSELAQKVCALRPKTKLALSNADKGMALLQGLDALRRDEPFNGFCETLAALEGQSTANHPAIQQLLAMRDAAAAVRAADLQHEGLSGPALGQAITERRIRAIAEVIGGD